MAVMADLARMPTQKKVLVFAAIGMAIGLIYYQFVFKGLRQDLQAAEGEHAAKLSTLRQREAEIPQFEQLKAHMNVLRKIIDENQRALPTEAEMPAFFETLNRKVLESGVEVNSWKQLPEKKVESFVRVPVEIEMTGTFMQIKRFFASLMPARVRATTADGAVPDRERIVSIENLSLDHPAVKNHEIVLTAHFTAMTYRQEETTDTKGAAHAALPPPAAPAKLPPASTPQGAKVRVEQSLHKGDMRNRNAAGVKEAQTPKAPAGSASRLKGGL